jgi:hypothetical protein
MMCADAIDPTNDHRADPSSHPNWDVRVSILVRRMERDARRAMKWDTCLVSTTQPLHLAPHQSPRLQPRTYHNQDTLTQNRQRIRRRDDEGRKREPKRRRHLLGCSYVFFSSPHFHITNTILQVSELFMMMTTTGNP